MTDTKSAAEIDARKHQDIIRKIFYDVKSGFGSQAKTLIAAKNVNPLITADEVRTFFQNQEQKQTSKRRTDNSYVAFGPLETISLDLVDFFSRPAGRFRYALLAIDIFTKKVAAIPIPNKFPETTAEAFEQILSEMGVPNQAYTDEGGEFVGSFEKTLEKYMIEHAISRAPPMFVERMIRTLRQGVNDRLTALKLPTSDWYKVLPYVLDKYNSEVHTTTKASPDDAAKMDWEHNREEILELRGNIQKRAHKKRKYPKIVVGDRVKLLRKPGKYSEFKSTFNNWSTRTYRVLEITRDAVDGAPLFTLEDHPRKMRLHEILKVNDVQSAPRRKIVGKQRPEAALEIAPRPRAVPDPVPETAPAAIKRVRIAGKTHDPSYPPHALAGSIFGK